MSSFLSWWRSAPTKAGETLNGVDTLPDHAKVSQGNATAAMAVDEAPKVDSPRPEDGKVHSSSLSLKRKASSLADEEGLSGQPDVDKAVQQGDRHNAIGESEAASVGGTVPDAKQQKTQDMGQPAGHITSAHQVNWLPEGVNGWFSYLGWSQIQAPASNNTLDHADKSSPPETSKVPPVQTEEPSTTLSIPDDRETDKSHYLSDSPSAKNIDPRYPEAIKPTVANASEKSLSRSSSVHSQRRNHIIEAQAKPALSQFDKASIRSASSAQSNSAPTDQQPESDAYPQTTGRKSNDIVDQINSPLPAEETTPNMHTNTTKWNWFGYKPPSQDSHAPPKTSETEQGAKTIHSAKSDTSIEAAIHKDSGNANIPEAVDIPIGKEMSIPDDAKVVPDTNAQDTTKALASNDDAHESVSHEVRHLRRRVGARSPSVIEDGVGSSGASVNGTTDTVKDENRSLSGRPRSLRKPNVVLPSFDSQFVHSNIDEAFSNAAATDRSGNDDTDKSSNVLVKVLQTINALLCACSTARQRYSKLSSEATDYGTMSGYTGQPIQNQMMNRFSHFFGELNASPKDAKRFVIIGVHGWFPMKLVRSVIGEPTGTSFKFCEQMAKALTAYLANVHGITLSPDLVTLIPLEGEGKVMDRVQILYDNLMDNSDWCDALSSADVIFVATHSQGTPVSNILLERLLREGHIHIRRQQVCLLAMAGISHGPFPFLKGNLLVKYFEADAARELFDFMDLGSPITKRYDESLSFNLESGVKVVLVASMQDQVVPLYSAIMSGCSHPSILRAIYVDGHIYSEDDFLINLIMFALQLRNAGVSDHGLLVYVSEVLAGNLYAFEGGHSTIYEELDVYTLAAQYMFETFPIGDKTNWRRHQESVEATKQSDQKSAKTNPTTSYIGQPPVFLDDFQVHARINPFFLPWAMRGIIEDAEILGDTRLTAELTRLKELLSSWEPISSKLREVKYRLEPFRARL